MPWKKNFIFFFFFQDANEAPEHQNADKSEIEVVEDNITSWSLFLPWLNVHAIVQLLDLHEDLHPRWPWVISP